MCLFTEQNRSARPMFHPLIALSMAPSAPAQVSPPEDLAIRGSPFSRREEEAAVLGHLITLLSLLGWLRAFSVMVHVTILWKTLRIVPM